MDSLTCERKIKEDHYFISSVTWLLEYLQGSKQIFKKTQKLSKGQWKNMFKSFKIKKFTPAMWDQNQHT